MNNSNQKEGRYHIKLWNLRVVLFEEDQSWFAQGIDVDYLAEGNTREAAKQNFVFGLHATLHAYYARFGNLKPRLTPVPRSILQGIPEGAEAKVGLLYSESESVVPIKHWSSEAALAEFPYEAVQFAEITNRPKTQEAVNA